MTLFWMHCVMFWKPPPYYWQVVRADKRYLANDVPNNVAVWIDQSQCFAVDISEGNDNVMMELGHMYWGYPERPLIVLQREGISRPPTDLGGYIRILYPWGDSPSQEKIATKFREEILKLDEIKKPQRDYSFLVNATYAH